MDYFKFHILTDPENVDIIIAFLGELPFDSFEENEGGLNAYIAENQFDELVENQLSVLQKRIDFTINKELVKAQNWNSVWESNFSPIVVDEFCAIRADFHEKIQDVKYEIIINPKMAFGTGHHETTFMVMQMMQHLDFQDKTILDYGCGTGILAILASKLGAQNIDAVDIENASFENTIENAKKNDVFNINAIHGTIENVESFGYDIILANINRHVILTTMHSLYEKLSGNGKLIVSGILKQDEPLIVKKAEECGFLLKETVQKNKWICSLYVKK